MFEKSIIFFITGRLCPILCFRESYQSQIQFQTFHWLYVCYRPFETRLVVNGSRYTLAAISLRARNENVTHLWWKHYGHALLSTRLQIASAVKLVVGQTHSFFSRVSKDPCAPVTWHNIRPKPIIQISLPSACSTTSLGPNQRPAIN